MVRVISSMIMCAAVLIGLSLLSPFGGSAYDVYTYVSDYWQHSVVIVKNLTVQDHVELPGSTTNSVDITPDDSRIYATNGLEGVSVLDVSPSSKSYKKIIANVRTGQTSCSLRVHPEGNKVYVASSNSVQVIDTDPSSDTYNKVIKVIAMPRYTFDLDFSPGGEFLFVAFQEASPGNIGVIDTAEDHLVDIDENPNNGITCMTVGEYVGGSSWFKAIRISQHGYGYLLNSGQTGKGYGYGNTVSVFDTSSFQAVDVGNEHSGRSHDDNEGIASIVLPGFLPVALWFSPQSDRLYICERDTLSDSSGPKGKLIVIDSDPTSPRFNRIIKVREAGFRPEGVCVWPDGRFIFVSCRFEHQIRVFDRNLNPVINIPVNYPGQMVSVKRPTTRVTN